MIVVKSIEAFQQTEEYNTVLFSWCYKGFELLQRHLVKHRTGVDLKDQDFEAIDKEMSAGEAAQASQAAQAAIVALEGGVLESAEDNGGEAGF